MHFCVRIEPFPAYNHSASLAIPGPRAVRNPLRSTPPASGSGLRLRLLAPRGKAIVGAGVFGAFGPAGQAADARRRLVEGQDVGLQVQQGRAVEDVHVHDLQPGAAHRHQPHEREPDRVGAGGGAGGKDAPRPVIHEGRDGQPRRPAAVEEVDQEDVREALQVAQSLLESRVERHPAAHAAGAGGLDGHVLGALEGRVDRADRLQLDGVHGDLPGNEKRRPECCGRMVSRHRVHQAPQGPLNRAHLLALHVGAAPFSIPISGFRIKAEGIRLFVWLIRPP